MLRRPGDVDEFDVGTPNSGRSLELKGKYEDFILIEYGLGIACGIMSEGRFITGSRGMAGELGHTHVPDFHGHCECGSVGCLEAAAALPAISREMECDGRGACPRTRG